ncbi:uncharacterized protein LOC124695415 [Lolium rigidum]|uniref:uncharacterized protein LOC124695415 n=1 Tax=Lolium rigidum TaxID=89674 RepID=UPI001F5DEDF2|nr:uncharacterized protein LOC124695415 [Lolium rigidum]
MAVEDGASLAIEQTAHVGEDRNARAYVREKIAEWVAWTLRRYVGLAPTEGRRRGGARKVAPLPADHVLGAGGLYVLLPATRGKVSADEARSVLTASRSLARSKSMPGGLMRKMSSRKSRDADGSAKHKATTGVAVAEMERREEPAAAVEDGFEDHRPVFLSRELSCRGWKPSLNTIEERVMPKKVSHWLF